MSVPVLRKADITCHPLSCCHAVRRPGMYMYMCMPAVARLQWHPISLAGSPSADSLAVLVRNSGEPARIQPVAMVLCSRRTQAGTRVVPTLNRLKLLLTNPSGSLLPSKEVAEDCA
jgi:FAD-binding domain